VSNEERLRNSVRESVPSGKKKIRLRESAAEGTASALFTERTASVKRRMSSKGSSVMNHLIDSRVIGRLIEKLRILNQFGTISHGCKVHYLPPTLFVFGCFMPALGVDDTVQSRVVN
jgi:hypothetical protein